MAAGVSGFLEGRDETLREVDEENRGWRDFVQAWQADFEETPVEARSLLKIARKHVPEAVEGKIPGSQVSQLGKALRAHRRRTIAGCKIVETSVRDDKSRERNGWVLKTPNRYWDVGTLGEESKISKNSRRFDTPRGPNIATNYLGN
jgi:hypothetical protein